MEKDLEYERQETEEHKSRIDSARDSLYQPGGPSIIHKQDDPGRLPRDEDTAPPQEWAPPAPPCSFDMEKLAAKANILFRRIFFGALAFFVLSLVVAAFMYFYGNNTISSRNIKIDISAPSSVPSSDTFSFDITVQNGNNADLINSAIVIDYPEGARYADDSAKPLVSERIDLGILGKGQLVKKGVSARLFGEENAEKKIVVRLEYEVLGSNAHFTKDVDFTVALRLSPIVLSVEALKEENSNQEVKLVAKIISNSNNILSNVSLNIDYPFGFTYTSSNLEVDGKRGEFPLGDLQPNETKTVDIRGIISGQSAEDKIFKFSVGTSRSADEAKVTTVLATHIHNMVIRGDFLASSIVFNDRKGYATLDTPLRGTIQWKNTLPDPINDATFTLKISGDLIDLDNISSNEGYYDSNKGVIQWNKSINKELEEIAPGEIGSFGFTISLLDVAEALKQRITNPKINLSFDVHGRRLNDKDVTEDIESSFIKTVPVVTEVVMDTKTLYHTGPLKNSGPIPPKAENKTTYTIALFLTNTVNAVTDGEVTATLPNYVKYEGEATPSSDKVSWNENTRQLRWSVGNLPPRTGFGAAARTLYFKVSVTPSRTQVGQVLQLVNGIAFTGKDAFVEADIQENGPTPTTALQDTGVEFGGGQVIQ